MRGRGERASVIHRRADCNAGGHLVIQKTADFFAQQRGDVVVECVVSAGFGRVDAAGEVSFEETQDGLRVPAAC